MACSISYLDNNYQGAELKKLRNKHINIVKQTISSKLFYKRNNALQLTMDLNSNIRTKQEDFVKSIPELSIIQKDEKDILLLKVDDKDSAFKYINGKDDTVTQGYDTDLKERIFNNKNKISSKEALNNIIDKSKNESLVLLSKTLLSKIEVDTDIDIYFRDKELIQNNALGVYNSGYLIDETPNIQIAGKAMFPFSNGEGTVIHEILHAMSYRALRKDSKLSNDFYKLWEYASNTVTEDHYGLKDYDEFLTEVFTNGKFIKTLIKYPPSGITNYKNLFEEIIDKILSFFNIKGEDNLYTEILAISSQIIEQGNKPLRNFKFNYTRKTSNQDKDIESHFENNKTTVGEILGTIKNPGLQILVKNLNKYLTDKQRSIPIFLKELPSDMAGQYFHSSTNQRIEINRIANFAQGNSEKIILHEILHAMSLQFLNENKDTKLYKDFEKLFLDVKKRLLDENKDYYGLMDIYEFMSEGFTNGEFIEELLSMRSNINTEYENVFEEFVAMIVNFFKRIFDIKDNNVFEEFSKIASNIIALNSDIVSDNYMTFDEEVTYYSRVNNNSIQEQTEFSEYLEDKDAENNFLKMINKIKSNFDNYIDLLSDRSIDYPSSKREIKIAELKELKKILNDETKTEAIIGINNYITQSVQWIDIIHKEFFSDEENVPVLARVKRLNTLTGEEKQNELEAISKILNKSKHFLHLFDGLEDFQKDLKRDGFISSDKFNTKFFDEEHFIEVMATLTPVGKLDFLHAAFINGDMSLSDFKDSIITQYESENKNGTLEDYSNFRNDLKEAFAQSINPTFTSQMSYALGKATELKSEINNLHFKLTTEWLYPDYEAVQKNLGLKEDNPLFITKQRFEALLKIADSDENMIANWLEATIQAKDPLVSTLANKIAKAIDEAHRQSIRDATTITQARDDSGFNSLTDLEQESGYEDMTNMITVLAEDNFGNPVEVENTDENEGIVIDTLYGKRKYKTIKVKAWKTGKHTSLAEAKRKLINILIYKNNENAPGVIKDIMDKLVDEDGNLDPITLFNYLNSNLSFELSFPLLLEFFVTTTKPVGIKLFNGKPQLNNRYRLSGSALENMVKNRVKAVALKTLYYGVVQNNKTQDQLTAMLSNFNIVKLTTKEKEFLAENTNENTNINEFVSLVSFGNDGIVSIKVNGEVLYLYKSKKGMMFGSYSDVVDYGEAFYYKTNEFSELTNSYKLPEYSGNHKKYFNTLYELYKSKNRTLGNQRNKHGIVAQVEQTGIRASEILDSAGGFLTSIYDWFVNAFKSIGEAWNGLNNSNVDNSDEKLDFERQYLSGEKVKSIGARYTTILENQSKLEKDLSVGLLAFVSMANTRNTLKKYDGQIQVVRTIVAGDTLLGISARKAKKRSISNKIIKKVKGGDDDDNNFSKELNEGLNKKLLEFIDDMVYNEKEYAAFDLGFITSKGIERKTTAYTSYTNLALNILGSISNIGSGKVATYLEAIQGDSFTEKEWGEAELEYVKNIYTHYKDYKEDLMHKKSKIGQLTLILDAIQGEFRDNLMSFLKTKKFSEVAKGALFWTQSAPEHYIQTVNMIAMLKASKNKNGISLWDRINYVEGKAIELTPKLVEDLKQFQGLLHSVNRRLNGAYSDIDKSRLQRRWFGRLTLAFRKYIYQNYKGRFESERIDMQSGTLVRGYVTSYYSDLFNDLKSNRSYAYKGLKILKQAVNDNRRFALGVINTSTFGLLNKKIDVNKMYGYTNMEEREIKEAKRYIAEVSLYTTLTFLALALASLTEDDDDDSTLKLLELIAQRQKADMGAFLPTMINVPTGNIVPGFSTWDFATKTVKSPIPAMRVYDNSIGLLSQITGVDYTDEGIDFSINDVYTRSGFGYEKGDLKITRKIQKSLVSPVWQIVKLMNPEEQLKYLEMVNKNSK